MKTAEISGTEKGIRIYNKHKTDSRRKQNVQETTVFLEGITEDNFRNQRA